MDPIETDYCRWQRRMLVTFLNRTPDDAKIPITTSDVYKCRSPRGVWNGGNTATFMFGGLGQLATQFQMDHMARDNPVWYDLGVALFAFMVYGAIIAGIHRPINVSYHASMVANNRDLTKWMEKMISFPRHHCLLEVLRHMSNVRCHVCNRPTKDLEYTHAIPFTFFVKSKSRVELVNVFNCFFIEITWHVSISKDSVTFIVHICPQCVYYEAHRALFDRLLEAHQKDRLFALRR